MKEATATAIIVQRQPKHQYWGQFFYIWSIFLKTFKSHEFQELFPN